MNFKKFIFILSSIIVYLAKLNYANCPITLDLGIMIDVSGSIGKDYFDSTVKVLLNIADRINNKNKIFTSVVKYSNTPNIINVMVNDEISKKTLIDKIKASVIYDAVQTQTGFALWYTKRNFATIRDPNAPRILIIFSDGLIQPGGQYDFEAEAKNLKSIGVEIFIISISNQIDYNKLKLMASEPVVNHILDIDDYKKIYDLVNERTVNACNQNGFRFLTNYEND